MARGLLTDAPAQQAYFQELLSARQAVDNDARMATAMAQEGNVILAMAFLPGPKKNEPIPKFLEKAACVTFSNQKEIKNFFPTIMNDPVACCGVIHYFPESQTNPSAVFVDRCELFKVVPPVGPGEKWDGVFHLTKKCQE